MAKNFTYIRAPHPDHNVTMVLPSPLVRDDVASRSTINLQRTMLGDTWIYVKKSTSLDLVLPFLVTRPKYLEMEAFFRVYYRAPLEIETTYDASIYVGTLMTGMNGTAETRWIDNLEMLAITLEFSVEKTT